MNVRLRANEPVSRLAEQLKAVGGALAVAELDLTNCVDVDVPQLLPLIAECKQLQCLRCASCAIPSSDVVRLVVQQLPHLVEVEFSCLGGRDSSEAEINPIVASGSPRSGGASNLRRVYCEVGQDRHFARLLALMKHSPNVAHLHVHLLGGEFHKAVRECHTLIATCTRLETFTFTSELPSPFQNEPVVPLFFAKFAAVCANIRYHWSNNLWSCLRLQDLVIDSVERRCMPFQTVLVAVQDQKTPDRIRLASQKHTWQHVRQLCLVLLPPSQTCVYPAAGGSYLDCLREFSARLRHVVEVNISTFHFATGLDVSALLQEGSLQFLQSLSAPPCGFRCVSALRRLSLHCPDFRELDVRFETRGNLSRCEGCEDESSLVAEFRNCTGPAFPNGLAMLTLWYVRDVMCRWLIECCCPMATLRLSYCPSKLDFGRLCSTLADSTGTSCFILQHHIFRLDDVDLPTNVRRLADLRYLYLLSETPLSPNAALLAVTNACQSLPQLKCLHVHYQDVTDPAILKTITWLRGLRGVQGDYRVVQDGPCFEACSTATFIGLIKPLNRHIQPML
ncbi:hypothetical protein MRX96_009443 [Rhipicephalus microplus]